MKCVRIHGKSLRCVLLITAWLFPLALPAQVAWPTRPVTIVVGYPPGSGIELTARFLADGLRERTGQPFIVENRAGAIGNVGAQVVARAAPDGYTALYTPNSTHAANIHLFRQLGFHPVRDFSPVTTTVSQAFILAVNPQVMPVKTLAELTDYLKANPGKLAYGSGSAAGRVGAELYKSMTRFDAVHVPYKGMPQLYTDLMGGRIHFTFADAPVGLPMIRAGKLRALAVFTARRISFAPDIPTMAEAGLPGFELNSWHAVFMPAGAPREIVQRMAELTNAVFATDKGREFLLRGSMEAYPGSPESLGRLVESEMQKWGQIIRSAGIEPE